MRKIILYLFLLTVIAACKEKYDLPYAGPAAGYLVIDGVINSGSGPTTLRLTRSLALVDSVAFRFVTSAIVRVEGEDNSSQSLTESSGGVYSSPQLTFNDAVKYRLHINTPDGKEYISDYVPVMRTPDIDSISWEKEEDGVVIFVNTHDAQNKTLYYRWEYEETWEIHSDYYSLLIFETDQDGNPTDVDPRDQVESQQMYTCYPNSRSVNLLIGSSAKLSRDTIHLPIQKIPQADVKISVLYSILVRQYALSRGGFEYLQRMKKNTEQVGSLFDAQPSELVGNIKCVTDPAEPVIGYVDIADAKLKRTFIKRSEVLPWDYRTGCYETEVVNFPDSLELWATFIPTTVAKTSPLGDTLAVFVSPPECADCRLRGTHIKPSFWP
jgi:hypothetical protein